MAQYEYETLRGWEISLIRVWGVSMIGNTGSVVSTPNGSAGVFSVTTSVGKSN